jgi:predicted aminopeptidase
MFLRRAPRQVLQLALALLLGLVLLAGCGVPYYSQAIWGQGRLLLARRSVQRVIASPETDEATRGRLELLSAVRDFASRGLGLPDNESFRSYVRLERPHVLWNVIAAPELSTEPVQWCFPVAGCVAYRGYFSQRRAERYAAGLREQGLDTQVYGVAAFSTLGWFADPAMSTFLDWEEPELAELVFHELAHQRLYVKGDTTFNESFASFVAERGVGLWLREGGKAALLSDFEVRVDHRERFARLVAEYRSRLQSAYDMPQDDDWKRARKRQILAGLREAYESRSGGWREDSSYDEWFEQDLNNAHLVAVASYRDLVPAFRTLYERAGSDLATFYEEVERLARRSDGERKELLEEWADDQRRP